MKTSNQFRNFRLAALLIAALTIASCSSDDDGVEAPPPPNEVEIFTDVTLIFTNTADATDVIMATAQDPDGEGIQELTVDGPINLTAGTTYTLTYEILNALDPTDVEDIGAEILDEDDEHQFFFAFSNDAFANPAGNGNIDNASDSVNYADLDDNDLPVGLQTTWTTGGPLTGGVFNVRLQHQPPVNGNIVKTATSGSGDGDTDFDLEFTLNIQ